MTTEVTPTMVNPSERVPSTDPRMMGSPPVQRPWLAAQRLQNEAACLCYIRARTDIPVPKSIGIEYNDHYCGLITEYIEGIPMSELPEHKKTLVHTEIQQPIPLYGL